MRKLFAANNRKLWKSKLFWLELIFSAVFAAWIMFANYSPKIQASSSPLYLENVFFNMHQIFGIVFAVVISLTVGTEYSDGTIRNKLIVGHTRAEIYFSTLLTNVWASAAAMAVHGIVSYGVGYFLFGSFHISAAQTAAALLCAVLANLVFTALFTALALNCSNKAAGAVAAILLALLILVTANIAGNRLVESEMIYDGVTITADGIQFGEMIPNPNYVTGFMRRLCEITYHTLPSGQLMQIQSLELAHWPYWCVLSVLLLAAAAGAGYWLFKRKDIK